VLRRRILILCEQNWNPGRFEAAQQAAGVDALRALARVMFTLGASLRPNEACKGRWEKRQLTTIGKLPAEIHWYEAHGLSKKRLKIKRFLDKSYESHTPLPIRYLPQE